MVQSMLNMHRPAVLRLLWDFLSVLLSFTPTMVTSLCSEMQLREQQMERERGRQREREGEKEKASELEPDSD